MRAKHRITWSGNLQAQNEADLAYKKLKHNSTKKKKPKKRKKKLKNKSKTPNYISYLKSHKWRKKRIRFIEMAEGKCSICSNTKELQIHHRHYRTLGNESYKDVQVLCKNCHYREHFSYSPPVC